MSAHVTYFSFRIFMFELEHHILREIERFYQFKCACTYIPLFHGLTMKFNLLLSLGQVCRVDRPHLFVLHGGGVSVLSVLDGTCGSALVTACLFVEVPQLFLDLLIIQLVY